MLLLEVGPHLVLIALGVLEQSGGGVVCFCREGEFVQGGQVGGLELDGETEGPHFGVVPLVEGVDLHEEGLILVQEADGLLDLSDLAEDGVGDQLESEILVVLGEFLPEQGRELLVVVHELEEAVDLAFELFVAGEVNLCGGLEGVDAFDGGQLLDHVNVPAQFLQFAVQILEAGQGVLEDEAVSVGDEVQFLEESVEGEVDRTVLLLLFCAEELEFGGDLLVEGVVLVVELVGVLIEV